MIRVFRILALMAALGAGGAAVMAQPLRTGRTTGGIAYDIQGQGPVVVLITGSNLDRRMWRKEAAWLRGSFNATSKTGR
jgi:hypothetical protein